MLSIHLRLGPPSGLFPNSPLNDKIEFALGRLCNHDRCITNQFVMTTPNTWL
jgi:hypothetical protein